MAEALCCPISLEEFRDPRVLPCGHTVDLLSVPSGRSIRRCPLCRAPLASALENYPINWTVASFMGLEVAPTTIDARHGGQIRRLVHRIRLRMARRDVLRYHASVFLRGIPESDRFAVQKRISAELHELGFAVSETKILITQGCLCTSVRDDTFVVIVPK